MDDCFNASCDSFLSPRCDVVGFLANGSDIEAFRFALDIPEAWNDRVLLQIYASERTESEGRPYLQMQSTWLPWERTALGCSCLHRSMPTSMFRLSSNPSQTRDCFILNGTLWLLD